MAAAAFVHEERVRFAHCDPAGIVFFPQYLVMLNTLAVRAEFFGGDELRARFHQVLVCTCLATHRPQALPDDVRAALARYAGVP